METIFSPKTKKVIFFDLNNTLIDLHKTHDATFAAVVQDYTGRLGEEGGPVSEKLMQAYHEHWARGVQEGKAAKRADQVVLREASVRHALTSLPSTFGRGVKDRIRAQLDERLEEHIQLADGAHAALKELAGRYRLAVISNGNRQKLLNRMRTAKVSEFISEECVYTPSDSTKRKPHPDIFREAVRSMDVRRKQAVMVGDSKANDIYGALRAGLDAVWIRPSYRKKSSLQSAESGNLLIVRSVGQLTDFF